VPVLPAVAAMVLMVVALELRVMVVRVPAGTR
jgi:hypothetical protein